MLYEVRGHVADGMSFADAMMPWCGSTEAALIRAGEKAGELPDALRDAMFLVETQSGIWGSIAANCAYPLVLVGALGYQLNIVATRIVPAFASISPADSWEGSGRIMYVLAMFATTFGIPLAIAFVLFAVASLISMPRLTGPVRYYLDKLPPWSIYRRINGSIALISIAVQIRAGVKTQEALDTIAADSNAYLRERMMAAAQGVAKGSSLGEALRDAEYDFPDRTTIRNIVGLDKLDNFDAALRKASEKELKTVLAQTNAAMTTLNGVMIALVGLATMLIVGGSFGISNSVMTSY
jgi:type II secretory pathway component PulF